MEGLMKNRQILSETLFIDLKLCYTKQRISSMKDTYSKNSELKIGNFMGPYDPKNLPYSEIFNIKFLGKSPLI